MALTGDRLHRSTLKVYGNIMEQLNPSLQKLVTLGNNYIQAFQALAMASDAYFGALGMIGEQALQTMASRELGDVLIQISDSQRLLTSDLGGVFRWFHAEVLQEMDNNVKLDKDYIAGSRRRYELEFRNRMAWLEKQQTQLWASEKHRGRNQRDLQEQTENLQGEVQGFLRDSVQEAEREEQRRYRFLAEKHCGLSQSLLYLLSKTAGALQQQAEVWRERVNESRSGSKVKAGARSPAQSRPRTPSGRHTPTPAFQDNTSRSSTDGFRPIPHSGERELERQHQGRESTHSSRPPSRGPSPHHSGSRSRSSSLGEALGVNGGQRFQAVASHSAGSNPTLLNFHSGALITVLVPVPRNGWLYGREEGSAGQGWFPAAYVEPIGPEQETAQSRSWTLRSSQSTGDLLNEAAPRLQDSRNGAPPPAPPLPSNPSMKLVDQRSAMPSSRSRLQSDADDKRSSDLGSRPELFPRGTNPFATVKLKPTTTNDRSSPRTK
ncbi:brain-specific angiogenesis inhibitor 1-associated protein 2-like protein 2 [Acipenser ruthenus]|uniref:brain-specific angiogenesis inhibitor 1-associated protein 2-like protein 2 n=1 Tax=Acipenser ruthenus TaxID=7906 RepID=UPI002741D187|nr:brain-specific angiogenesis inhibitor 1-associated protein 2-like protein 2 [Acipenser ruthenus]